MIGAIVGDVVGSRFELNNHKSKEFEMFTKDCQVTDDSIMTLNQRGSDRRQKPTLQ